MDISFMYRCGHTLLHTAWIHQNVAEALHFLVSGLCSGGYALLRPQNVRHGMKDTEKLLDVKISCIADVYIDVFLYTHFVCIDVYIFTGEHTGQICIDVYIYIYIWMYGCIYTYIY